MTLPEQQKSLASVGAAWMLGSILSNMVELALIHELGPSWPSPVQLLWRQGVALLLLLPVILHDPRGTLSIKRPKILMFRSLAAMMALMLSIYGFSHLPIATANALTFTRPLWITLLAAVLLKERVDLWRGGAIALGFAGVLVMARPESAHDALLAQAAVLASAILFAASFVSIKSMSADSRTTTILVYGVLCGLILSAGPAIIAWRTPHLGDALLLAGLGATSLCTFACMTKALRMADAVALVGLDYLRLPLSIALGFMLFGEQPTGALLIGSFMIIAATAMVTLREQRTRKQIARVKPG